MYCGDETGSFIGDIGSTTSRFGYGGEDCPKLVIPSYLSNNYKSYPSSTTKLKSDEDIVPIYHQPSINEHNELSIDPNSYMNDGIISDFDAWENIWTQHAFKQLSISRSKSNDNFEKCLHPLLVIDSGNTHHCSDKYNKGIYKKQRETMVEIMFEKFGTPACFIAPAPMVQAFSMGRQTGVIVDMGSTGCRSTSVVDGLILKQSQRRNGYGGDWLSAMQLHLLQKDTINVKPRYMNVQEGNGRNYFNEFQMKELMYEMKTNYHVKLSMYDDSVAMDDESKRNMYTLPDGTTIDFNTHSYGNELIHLPDLLFSSNPFQDLKITPPPSPTNLPQTLAPDTSLPKLIHSCISSTDPDLRKELCNNIIVNGSHSLYPNLEKRLSNDVSNLCSSNFKIRVIASKNSIERKFSSWIGGSVLTSLGSFQQLWLGKTEYEEYGVLLSCNRFP